MKSVNKVILIGNVTWGPELKHTEANKPVCTFGLATNRNYTDGAGEKVEEVDYHRLVAFGKLGEQCEKFLRKGRKVYVEGRLHSHSWTDNEGQQKAVTEIILSDMTLLDKKPEDVPAGKVATESNGQQAATIAHLPLPRCSTRSRLPGDLGVLCFIPTYVYI
jgi:single-strand DNA-binding protein